MDGQRYLLVIADDFGIGPATSRGILDLAAQGRITGTVLLVNSPHAAQAVRHWQQSGIPLEVGWHPCLTLDRPVLHPRLVPSLVQPDGRFFPLGSLLRRLLKGHVRRADLTAELHAQYQRFRELVGHRPQFVNAHHHIQVFPPVGAVLWELLGHQRTSPYVRRVREPWRMLPAIPGARLKRAVLSLFGRYDARLQERAGFPGNDWLAGITDPPFVADPEYLVRWLTRVPGRIVELACHPGHEDLSLLGRDCTKDDGMVERRINELRLLRQTGFVEASQRAGFVLVPPSRLTELQPEGTHRAA